MPKTYTITKEQAEELREARRQTQDKMEAIRFHAVQLRGEGMENAEIAARLEVCSDTVSNWVSRYARGGVDALRKKPHLGNHRNMSFEEEQALLQQFVEKANAGQLVEVSEIKALYEKTVGSSIGGSQIYRVLARHGWRKIMPRSRHPKKADDEAIEASKKLTFDSRK